MGGRGAQLLTALATYLDEQQWPAGSGDGFTWAELAVDFEVSTGLDLPVQGRGPRGRVGRAALTGRPPGLMRRAAKLYSLVRALERLAPHATLTLGSRLNANRMTGVGGGRRASLWILTGLGRPGWVSGISHRPILGPPHGRRRSPPTML